MPQVGKKHFSYDAKGKAAAKKEAEKSGAEVKMNYAKGGKIKVRGTGAATKGLYARGPMG
tara:strand:- start:178 stop:357 length:180 start_codon:yes stop_codon:yes gene_type:complete